MGMTDRTDSGLKGLPSLALEIVACGTPTPADAASLRVRRAPALHRCIIRQGRRSPNWSERSERSEPKPETQTGRGFRGVVVVPTLS